MKNISCAAAVVALFFSLNAYAAYEDYNQRYGEYRFNQLPEKGAVSKTVWVGQWWSYKKDGVAHRFNADYDTKVYQPIEDQADWAQLSPAEKMDYYLGRQDKIDYDNLKTYIDKAGEIGTEIDEWIETRRELVHKLNKMIEEHSGDSSWKWSDTEEGKEYVELGEKIDEKKKALEELEVNVDTAYEWEVMEHGNGQFGVQYWWGHCNAWAAAACVEPEPLVPDSAQDGAVPIKDIPFNVGDVKGLLTEAWMECNSSFFGSRNERHDDEADRGGIDYRDVTPAAFHIFFADQIGNRDKAFVIDEFTGAEVWNQPVKAYWTACEPQYEIDDQGSATAEPTEVKLTHYGGWYGGDPEVKSLGEKEVYPVLCTSTVHWMSDGVAHDAVTADYRFDDFTEENFRSGSYVSSHFGGHVAIRTLSYVLWLDRPMGDESAHIIGDGEWNHGATWDYAHAHPDFMWQPTANSNNSGRDYENPFVDYEILKSEIQPQLLADHDNPEVEAHEFASTDTPLDIPDGGPGNTVGEPVTSVINIGDELDVNEMQVRVEITHTYISDVQITLTSPEGKEAVLRKFGLGGGADDIHETYDVKDFDGERATGEWTLKVSDYWAADTGTLDSWTILAK